MIALLLSLFCVSEMAQGQLPRDVIECRFAGTKGLQLRLVVNDEKNVRVMAGGAIICAPKFIGAHVIGRSDDAVYIRLDIAGCRGVDSIVTKDWLSDGNLTLQRDSKKKWQGTVNVLHSPNGRSTSCSELKLGRGYPEKFVPTTQM
jgi:hypothetical protein